MKKSDHNIEYKSSWQDADLKFHEVVEDNLIQLKEHIGEMLNTRFFIHPIDKNSCRLEGGRGHDFTT